MIFPNLWGLLLLLAIPILVIIYVIKRENRERAVSGTYLWHLSERFLKKRLPIKRVSVFLTFLLQLIILSLFAVSAMQPAMTLGQFSGKIVVIDASASMLTEQDGVSRFDAAVEKAKDLAESGLCASMTVIVASDTPACLVMGGSMSEALDALDSATCGYGGMDLYEAMKLVREASSRIGLAQVILYTDTEFADVENVEIVDMRRGEKNLAVTELTHTGGVFEGTLVSYGEAREVSAKLCVDGEVVETQTVSCPDGEPATVKFAATATGFESATLLVDVKDALEIDNSFSVAGPRLNPVSVLVIGSEVLFFEKAFEALGNCEVTVQESYRLEDEGRYDLYVFSSCVPSWDSLPRSGVTLGFTQCNNNPDYFSRTILSKLHLSIAQYGQTGLTPQHDLRLEIDPLWAGMDAALRDVYVRLLYRCSIRNTSLDNGILDIWEPILGAEYADLNMTLRRILDNGTRHYIFLFPISQSNLALTPAFPMLLQNACGLAVPSPLERSHYAVGETVELSLGEVSQSPTMTTPDGTVTELADAAAFVPTYPGMYTLSYDVVQKPSENDPLGDLFDRLDENDTESEEEAEPEEKPRTRTASFFVHISPSEYETHSGETIYYTNTFDIQRDGKQMTNTLLPFAAVLLTALILFEWGYFYRGKH